MPDSAQVLSALQIVAVALTGLAAVRLRWLGLNQRYRIFIVYLIFRACRSILLLFFDRRSHGYVYAFEATEPMLWILYVLVVLELYSLVLEQFPGIYTAGRRVLWAALAVSI